MSNEHGPASRHPVLISLVSGALIITGALIAVEVGASSPPLLAIGIAGWMCTATAAWAWMAKTLLRMNRELTEAHEEARRHREKLNAELRKDVADLNHDLSLKVIMWLIEHQGQVQKMERSAHAMDHALGVAERHIDCQPDELAERRAAR